jgi:RNA polymerase sigma-32 factor
VSALQKAIKAAPVLTADEEQELFERYLLDKDPRAYDQLILSNLRFVIGIAHEYSELGFELDDLISEGTRGLIEAIRKYEPCGRRFCSYAGTRIRNYIEKFIQGNHSIIRLGTTDSQRKLFFHLPRLIHEFTLDEIAADYDLPLKSVVELYLLMNESVSSEELFFVADRRHSEKNMYSRLEWQEVKLAAEQVLTPAELKIVTEHYLSDNPRSYTEIAPEVNLTVARCAQLGKSGVSKLKKHFNQMEV